MPIFSLPDKAKLLFLLLVLIFMIGSYFTSDPFLLGFSVTTSMRVERMSGILCARRPESEQYDCRVDAKRALMPVDLACMSVRRDAYVCELSAGRSRKRKDLDGEHNPRCTKEEARLMECVQTRLEPQLRRHAFTTEEIAQLGADDLTKPPEVKVYEGDGGGGGEAGGQERESKEGDTAEARGKGGVKEDGGEIQGGPDVHVHPEGEGGEESDGNAR